MEMKGRNKYLMKNTIIFAISNFATKLISFFLLPLYTGILSKEEYGTVDLLFTICTVLFPIITFNINEAILRFSMDSNANYDKIMSIGIFSLFFATIIGLIVIPILNIFESYKDLSIYFYLYLISICYTQVLLANLKGKEQLVEFSIGNILNCVFIALFNILFLAILKLKMKGYFLAYILAHLITSIYALKTGNVIETIKKFKFDKKLFMKMIKYSIVLIPTSFMWWIMNSSDRIMVTNMIDNGANGIYAISYKFPSMLSIITSVFTQAWIFSAVKEKNSEDKNEYTSKVFNLLVEYVIIIAIGLIAGIKLLLHIFVADSYYSAWKYTPILILGYVFLTLASFISSSYNVHKDSKGFLFSGMAGAILNIILNFILIPKFKIYGAAIATAISYITVYVYRIFDTKKYVNISINKQKFLILIILLFVSLVSVYIDNMLGQLLLLLLLFLALLTARKDISFFIKKIVYLFQQKLRRKYTDE